MKISTLSMTLLLNASMACATTNKSTQSEVAQSAFKEGKAEVSAKLVGATYSKLALAKYEDALLTAFALKKSIAALVQTPTESNLKKARESWVLARVPYQQTEVYRFGNPKVDEWEGKVNAWPLDEGLIDYVKEDSYGESEDNPYHTANIIQNPKLKLSGRVVDTTTLDAKALQSLHEIDGIESNVATGYHAVEFLLWGQDLNGFSAGAGARPASDFNVSKCNKGNCKRRAAYLVAATDLLIQDLEEMVANWKPNGAIAKVIATESSNEVLNRILTGMGSLSYGELAGERIKLGLMLHDPEEEHDCFADNTHASHFDNVKGIQNVYLGKYTRPNGAVVQGVSLSSLVKMTNPKLDKQMKTELANSVAKANVLVELAKKGQAYDTLLSPKNKMGSKVIMDLVNALTTQTKSIEKIAAQLQVAKLAVEGSDSLDKPESIGN